MSPMAFSKAADIAAAALRPSPMARMTVAGPCTMSPPAYMAGNDDFIEALSTMISPLLVISTTPSSFKGGLGM